MLRTHLRNTVWKEGPLFLSKQWFLLQDNARPHILPVTVETLADITGAPVEHPDSIPCDFWAFLTLKHSYEERNSNIAMRREIQT
jgi:hypothetical protein